MSMEIAVSSTWSITEPALWRYQRTRFPLVRFVPLALFLMLAAAALGNVTPALVPLVLAWLFQFRLMDDLADRAHDPRERVLVQADARPFIALAAVVVLGNTALTAWLLPGLRWAEFLALCVLLLCWYAVRRRSLLLNSFVVLVKYPVFVYLLSDPGAAGWTLAGVLGLVYTCFLAYEVLHDPRWQQAWGSTAWLLAALAAMVAAALLPATGVAWIGPGCLVLAWLCLRHWRRLEPGYWPYAVFLVGCLWLSTQYSVLSTFGSP